MFFPGLFYYKELNCSESSLIIKANESKQLNPFFVTGFVDAEGCFSIIFQKRENFNLGWQVRAEFLIHLHNKDTKLLKEFQSFF